MKRKSDSKQRQPYTSIGSSVRENETESDAHRKWPVRAADARARLSALVTHRELAPVHHLCARPEPRSLLIITPGLMRAYSTLSKEILSIIPDYVVRSGGRYPSPGACGGARAHAAEGAVSSARQ
ncbi:hypothetical protein EVAR_87899_1 [Eumeta japonica]|uniref:Uncharacterized protein n=1 Tax=Eumeta variegata TaxID=151549 RepID=A0A4C1WTJ8_EUMVA|nr:hypothetical protein EVAR_87899_1 [Eumeta japonica]